MKSYVLCLIILAFAAAHIIHSLSSAKFVITALAGGRQNTEVPGRTIFEQ